MPLVIPNDEGGSYEMCPEGNHVAVCVGITDMGTHENTFEGKKTGDKRKIRILWEIAEEQRKDEKPFVLFKTYNLSMNEKSTFRKDLESWRGQKFKPQDLGAWEIRRILSVGCMLNVVHKTKEDGKVFDDIAGIARLPKGMTAPRPVTVPMMFSLEPDEYNQAIFDALPDKVKEVIKASPEYAKLTISLDKNGIPVASETEADPGF